MKTLTLAATFFAGLGLLSAQPLAQPPRYRPDHILVKPTVPVTELAVVHAQMGTQVRKSFARFGNLQVVKLPPGASVAGMVAEYQRSGLVEYAEPDYIVTVDSANHPNDPHYTNGWLWGLNNTTDTDIDAPEAWHFRTSAEAVVVAVIDSGVWYTHADLVTNMWHNPDEIDNGEDDDGNGIADDIYGIMFKDGDSSGDPLDDAGHGTHVAGIVGAVGNNGEGVVGVAWRVQIMACKFLHPTPGGALEGNASDAIACIDYAIAKGANIINASWGFSPVRLRLWMTPSARQATTGSSLFPLRAMPART